MRLRALPAPVPAEISSVGCACTWCKNNPNAAGGIDYHGLDRLDPDLHYSAVTPDGKPSAVVSCARCSTIRQALQNPFKHGHFSLTQRLDHLEEMVAVITSLKTKAAAGDQEAKHILDQAG